MTVKHLERLAVDAHRRGWNWERFWTQHGPEVIAAEPFDAGRFHRLVRRLLSLVVAGNLDGQEPLDVEQLWGIPSISLES